MKINVSELKSIIPELRAGTRIELTGFIYTARDAAHKRLCALLDSGSPLPFDIKDAVIYYAGPSPAPDGLPIGACGPTTSGRMDVFAPQLLDSGLAAMIGKGERCEAVKEAIIRNKAIYLSAPGGAGALAAERIKSNEVIAFPELGCESINKLYTEDFPLTVALDCTGRCVYEQERKNYAII
ncbi:MAG: FumA C-terminus/TtdB family hydratase beta subunit [Oscillospiraceae bacterium]|nr:FumA C-terminus/TtdB family hydratase beta subunit [Oscillospiraceae bacterium]